MKTYGTLLTRLVGDGIGVVPKCAFFAENVDDLHVRHLVRAISHLDGFGARELGSGLDLDLSRSSTRWVWNLSTLGFITC
jgi:hypothetical protein